jgi:hypothetical protein
MRSLGSAADTARRTADVNRRRGSARARRLVAASPGSVAWLIQPGSYMRRMQK